MTENLDQARSLISEAVMCEIGDIPDDASISSFEPWDSLAHVRLIFALEEWSGEQLPITTIIEMKSLLDVAGYLNANAGVAG